MKRVLFRPQAARDLERLPNRNRDQVEQAIERFAQTGAGDIKMLAGEGRANSGCASEIGEFVSCMRSRTSFGFCTFATAAKHTVEVGTVIGAAHTNVLGSRGMSQKTSDFSAIPLCSRGITGRIRMRTIISAKGGLRKVTRSVCPNSYRL